MVGQSSGDRVGSVNRSAMSLTQRLGTAALLVAVAAIGMGPAAQAHGDHHHHHRSHKKQKAYNKGYRRGYKRAIENNYRPHYRTYAPIYAPVPQRIIVSPAPLIAPIHPYHPGTRVNVGLGFNL